MLNEKSSLNIAAVSSQHTKERDYWLRKLFAPPLPAGFPYDYQKNNTGKNSSRTITSSPLDIVEVKFSRDVSAKLIEMSNGSPARLFMILAAGSIVLINKYSGKNDIIIGTSIIKQEEGFQSINEVLALRSLLESDMTFKELILQVKDTFLEAVENQDYPYETLLYKLGIDSPGDAPILFEAVLLLEQLHEKKYILHTRPNIILSFRSVAESIEGEMEYNPDLYSRTTAREVVSHLEILLQKALFNVGSTLSRLDILSAQEKKQLLMEFNDTAAPYPMGSTIHRLCEAQAQRTPDAIALVDTDESCSTTYRELNREADRLAVRLRTGGVVRNSIVGILVDQPLPMVVGLMAILKAGGAYLPIDPTYPAERIKYLVQESGLQFLLVNNYLFAPQREVYRNIPPANIISLEAEAYTSCSTDKFTPPPHINDHLDIAYIFYTSGTTGKPKGVMIRHDSVVNLLTWYGKTYEIKKDTRVLQLSNYTFDPSVEDIFGTLLFGATIVIGSRELPANREKFARYVDKYQVNLLDFVPTVLDDLLGSQDRLNSVRVVIVGGEILTEEAKQRIIERGYRLYNHYGPTEITVDATMQECSHESVTIGCPIANVACYILDNFLNPVPYGVSGELYISGAGAARGYLNNPGLTDRKFIKNPFRPGDRMYKTGDLARRQRDGKIQFLGRTDLQVKIRGHRIELQEIESCLLKHPDVAAAVVIADKDGKEEIGLYAYFVSGKEISSSEIAKYLSDHLPTYMIPRYSQQLQQLPLTPNGKIDRKMLPALNLKTEEIYAPPSDSIEEKLVQIWSAILEIEKNTLSINANFFELGGYSLNAAEVMASIQKEFNVDIPLVELFKSPTIKFLAEYIRNPHTKPGTITPREQNLILLSPGAAGDNNLFWVYDGTGEVEGYVELCRRLNIGFHCWGICADHRETLAPLNLTIPDIARKYVEKIKTIQTGGSYFLGGYSIGGTIAYEMALQLEEMKEKVSFLGLIDAPGPRENWEPGMSLFSKESELTWLWELLPDEEIKGKLKQVQYIDEIWSTIVAHLEENHHGIETVKRLIPERMAREIPAYHSQDTRELIYYLNFNRTLGNALAFYTPHQLAHTSIHYLKASESQGISGICWKDYCLKPIKFHEIIGDHFDILTKPNVIQTAKIIDQIILEFIR